MVSGILVKLLFRVEIVREDFFSSLEKKISVRPHGMLSIYSSYDKVEQQNAHRHVYRHVKLEVVIYWGNMGYTKFI